MSLDVSDPASIEGWLIRSRRLTGLIERVSASSAASRRAWPVLGTGRSDILVAGAVVVRLLAERFRSRGLVCSTQGLRYGLARLAAAEAMADLGGNPGGHPGGHPGESPRRRPGGRAARPPGGSRSS